MYEPVIAWCQHRQQSITDKAALEELRMVVTLCEGLDRQEALISKALFPDKDAAMRKQVADWEESVRLNPPKRVTDFRLPWKGK